MGAQAQGCGRCLSLPTRLRGTSLAFRRALRGAGMGRPGPGHGVRLCAGQAALPQRGPLPCLHPVRMDGSVFPFVALVLDARGRK